MTSRSNLYIGIGLLLVVFALATLSGTVLKHPITGCDDIISNLNSMETAVTETDWDEAGQILPQLETAWKKVKPRMYISTEKDDVIKFDDTLSTLKAAVNSRHQALALRDVALLKQTFKTLE